MIDPVRGVSVRTLDLGKFGHSGSTKKFNPPREIARFKISGPEFPKVRQVLLVLAERDAAGGFGDHLKKVAAKAQAKLDSAKHQVTADFSRPRLLLASYMQVEEIGKEVGEEALKRLGKDVFAIARDQFADDIFTPSMEDITVRKNSFRPGGARTVRFEYKKNKCDYSVIYSWRLSD